MKVSVNDEILFELNDIHKKVLADELHADSIEDDMKRRMQYIIMYKYETIMKKLRSKWEPKLKKEGVKMLPTDDEEFAQLVFDHPEYQCRTTREKVRFDHTL